MKAEFHNIIVHGVPNPKKLQGEKVLVILEKQIRFADQWYPNHYNKRSEYGSQITSRRI